MFKCENCPYHYKNENDEFACCHFEGNFLAPCDRTAQAPTNKKLAFLEEDDYEGEPYEDVVDDYDGWDDEEEEYE